MTTIAAVVLYAYCAACFVLLYFPFERSTKPAVSQRSFSETTVSLCGPQWLIGDFQTNDLRRGRMYNEPPGPFSDDDQTRCTRLAMTGSPPPPRPCVFINDNESRS